MIDLLTGWPLFVGLLAIIAVLVVQIPFEDVKRGRVERFARREALPITVGNGPVVIRYLATTRRWRGTGLLTAFALAILLPLVRSDGQIRIEEVWAFIGWFIGAVIAEWRVSVAATESRHIASLRPRRAVDYVRRRVWVFAGLIWLAVAALAVAGIGYASLGPHRPLRSVEAYLAAMAVVGAGLLLVIRHVLARSQPQVEADVLAADNAVRSRSLHVLAGSAIAIGGYFGAGAAAALSTHGGFLGHGVGQFLVLIGAVVLPVVGWFSATARVRVRPVRPVVVGARP